MTSISSDYNPGQEDAVSQISIELDTLVRRHIASKDGFIGSSGPAAAVRSKRLGDMSSTGGLQPNPKTAKDYKLAEEPSSVRTRTYLTVPKLVLQEEFDDYDDDDESLQSRTTMRTPTSSVNLDVSELKYFEREMSQKTRN